MASTRASIKKEIANYLNCSVNIKIDPPNRDHPSWTIYNAYFRDGDDYDENCNTDVDDYIGGIFSNYGGSLARCDSDRGSLWIWWAMQE